ncbi:MAG: glycosyltransferase family 4 protein [Rhodocyclaceae bacterium]|nr:glycosyltransferase family 4 protein [Rhodocyclaceae bacterium]
MLYIAPSILPSRAANAVHVVMQCDALSREAGCQVTLLAQRSIRDAAALPRALESAFGTDLARVELRTVHGRTPRMASLRIAALLLPLISRLPDFEVVLSRNLYASWLLAIILKRPLLFETHQLETGFRKRMQRAIMRSARVTTIVISQRLQEALEEHHGCRPRRVEVLHDAAPSGMVRLPPAERADGLSRLLPTLGISPAPVCGYFGHLYPGRGIEIIIEMARKAPEAGFLVVGGNPDDVARIRELCSGLGNVYIAGHVPHQVARAAMSACDILLMPYQKQVSIGVAGHDTARWMSPMKMFEYMGAGVPIISSCLPVLEEVLRPESNCLMVPPDQADAWLVAMRRLIGDSQLADAIGARAHQDYLEAHTWSARARHILSMAHKASHA